MSSSRSTRPGNFDKENTSDGLNKDRSKNSFERNSNLCENFNLTGNIYQRDTFSDNSNKRIISVVQNPVSIDSRE